jgi:cytochrome P450
LSVQNLAERDYFTDYSILRDPYEYFEALRAKGPVHELPGRDVLVVTGFNEALDVLRNDKDFSSVNCVQGAAAPLPFPTTGDDLTPQIEANRERVPGGTSLVAYDDTQHAYSRSILSRLFTPSRLKANEEFMTAYGDQLVKDAVAKGSCELIKDIATPFVTLVIADLLGVPADDRELFMRVIAEAPPPGNMADAEAKDRKPGPLEFMAGYFARYIADRRATPRNDVLTDLALAKYPDGSTPDLMELVRLSTFLFGAGQDTSAKLLGNAMRFLIEVPGLQDKLRKEPALIPQFLEETLRLEGSTKITSRLARKNTRIGDLDIPVGKRILIAFAAANRDPRRWEEPQDFKLGRPRINEHVAFGRGPHVCAGAPLARVEVRVIFERFLAHTSNIDIAADKHGPRGQRTLNYEPSFIIRGLDSMHLTLAPR